MERRDALSAEESLRYRRHLALPEVGVTGQTRLRASSAVVVGAGGLGSPAALYLAAAGVGRLGLVDFDDVDVTNLQRQILYGTSDVGQPKLDAARRRLEDANPHVRVETHATRLAPENAKDILGAYDVVVDGTDNFPTRYLVNDAAVLLAKPYVYGSIFRFEGQVSVFWPGRGPCYRCLFPEPPLAGEVPSCAEGGVLGVLPGVVGSLQAAEAIKLLLGRGTPLVGRLLVVDVLAGRFRELELRRDPRCPACGDSPSITDLAAGGAACEPPATEIDPPSLRARLDRGEAVRLLDVRTAEERAICRLPGAAWIPMSELAARAGELDPASELVVYCHRGARSAMAAGWLRGRGFARVLNLVGGIDAWAARVEPGMPRY
jgi:adenylyltransferase/sulfurtransferase